MSNIFDSVPLDIKLVLWDGNTLTLSGTDWSFSTLSAWRILNESSIEFACWDNEIDENIKKLEGKFIIGADRQSSIIAVDPVFKLSNGKRLEIFSSDTFEPWVLKLLNGKVFMGALPACAGNVELV